MHMSWTPEDIKEFEQKFNVKCTLRPDGLYDVEGDIYLTRDGDDYDEDDEEEYDLTEYEDLSEIPPIHTLTGSFICKENGLSDLIGSPKIVTEYFIASWNTLVSLEGAPEKVGMDFDCSANGLYDLEFAPISIGRNFDCSHNDLHSLDGAPKSIGEDFNCSHNPNLKITRSQLNDMNIKGSITYDPDQLVPDDPSIFIDKNLLPI